MMQYLFTRTKIYIVFYNIHWIFKWTETLIIRYKILVTCLIEKKKLNGMVIFEKGNCKRIKGVLVLLTTGLMWARSRLREGDEKHGARCSFHNVFIWKTLYVQLGRKKKKRTKAATQTLLIFLPLQTTEGHIKFFSPSFFHLKCPLSC